MLAGSETQVMSLWQVSDDATRDLMIAYYRLLQDDAGRGEALRQVQLAMLAGAQRAGDEWNTRGLDLRPGGDRGSGNWSHPFYWAAFTGSGAWQGMGENRAGAK